MDDNIYTSKPTTAGFKELGTRVYVERFKSYGIVTGKSEDLLKVNLDIGGVCWNLKEQIAARAACYRFVS